MQLPKKRALVLTRLPAQKISGSEAALLLGALGTSSSATQASLKLNVP